MKRMTFLAIVLGLLVVCPIFASENRAAARTDEPAACQPNDTASLFKRDAGTGAPNGTSRPNLRLQAEDDWCAVGCYFSMLNNIQDMGPYPIFWVKVEMCTVKCRMME